VAHDLVADLGMALRSRYDVERQLAHGGSSIVFLARDVRHHRDVAIKVLRPELASAVAAARFQREIEVVAQLQHPHILPLFDSGIAEDLLYFVMPYVEEESLRQRLTREHRIPVDEAVRLTREVADALGYAHARGVVHRDIKPGNVLLSGGHAIVADFGIARALAATTKTGATTDVAIGTPDYMSPEQIAADGPIDGRCDQYALACVLYEMVVGAPPFAGLSVHATLQRHLHDPPPSIRVAMSDVPVRIDQAVQRAMAKDPAQRFETMTAFAEALTPTQEIVPTAPARPRRAVWATASAATAIALAVLFWQQGRTRAFAPLDPNRVVVFPLRTAAPASASGSGENLAILLGYALEGTEPLRWLDGGDEVDARRRSDPSSLTAADRRAIARGQRAAYFIDGALTEERDSTSVLLRLHSVSGDSVVATSRVAAAASAAPSPSSLVLRGVGPLLVALLAPGHAVDISALSDRTPAAIANFLQGERAYRRSRFADALQLYRQAVSDDSSLALAALKGAMAAQWLGRTEEAATLSARAVSQRALLPPRYASFARGLAAYISGKADSSVATLRQLVDRDPTWGEAWFALGENYYHLLPAPSGADSFPPSAMADSAFRRAVRADSEFTPALYHVAQILLRNGDAQGATRYVEAIDRASPDSNYRLELHLTLRCVRDGSARVSWVDERRAHPRALLDAAKVLSGNLGQARCAEAAFRTVFADSTASESERWGALLALNSILMAEGRLREVDSLIASPPAAGLRASALYLIDAAAGAGFHDEARAEATRRSKRDATAGGPSLWLVGEWAASLGDVPRLRDVAHALARVASTSHDRSDSLMWRALDARLAMASADTTGALDKLRTLQPTGFVSDIEWQPWESLPAERLELATLLVARQQFAEAEAVAAYFDSPSPIVYPLYLPASLALRLRIAKAADDRRLVGELEQRLRRLRGDSARALDASRSHH